MSFLNELAKKVWKREKQEIVGELVGEAIRQAGGNSSEQRAERRGRAVRLLKGMETDLRLAKVNANVRLNLTAIIGLVESL